nr:Alpha crystallin/Hsp20 domain-containing protein [Ipomoea batatas]
MSLIPSIFGARRSNIFDPFSLDLWDPFQGFPFSSAVANAPGASAAEASAFANARIDWKETPEAHVFKADLPGLKKEEVKVEVEEGRVLQISGERSREQEEKNDKWHRVERSSGKFLRRFRLPENAKLDEVKASMEDGVLTLSSSFKEKAWYLNQLGKGLLLKAELSKLQRDSVADLWDPFEGFPFSSAVANAPGGSAGETSAFANARIDWKETPEAHVFKADLPGLKKEEVKVEVEEGKVLQISGERSRELEEKNDKWHRVERSNGKFLRRFRLPENTKMDEVKTSMENGVLTVTIPKVEVKKPEIKAINISA